MLRRRFRRTRGSRAARSSPPVATTATNIHWSSRCAHAVTPAVMGLMSINRPPRNDAFLSAACRCRGGAIEFAAASSIPDAPPVPAMNAHNPAGEEKERPSHEMVRHKSAPESQGLVLVNASQINCACRARAGEADQRQAPVSRDRNAFSATSVRARQKYEHAHSASDCVWDSLLKEETHNPTHNEKNRALCQDRRRPPEIPTVTPPISRPIE